MTAQSLSGTYRKYIPGRFLAADDLPPGREVTLTIAGASLETIEDPAQRGKQLLALHFEETEKLLGLNKTNAAAIARLTGTPEVEKWAGHKVTIHREEVQAFGQKVPAVRVVVPRGKRSGGGHG